MFTLLGLSQHELKLAARLRPKNKFEQQYHGRKRRVFKIFGERRGKTVTMRFGDVIIGVAVSAPKCLHIGNSKISWCPVNLFIIDALVTFIAFSFHVL